MLDTVKDWDWGAVIAAFILAIPASAAWWTSRATHKSVNSRMDKFQKEQKVEFQQLLKEATTAAYARGAKDTEDKRNS